MKVVIFAGGLGTRIRDVSTEMPKPMIPIGPFPVVWHIMQIYAAYNIKNFVLCLGYKGETIKDYFLNYQKRQNDFTLNLKSQQIDFHTNNTLNDWTITFAETGEQSLTGKRLALVKKYIAHDDYFMVTYGDGVGNIDIAKLLKFHKSHGKLMTVTGAHPVGRFGELDTRASKVVAFNEKPQTSEGWISAGYFVCSRAVLDYVTDDTHLMFEQEPLERILKEEQLMVYKHEGFWHPMDTLRDYQLLNNMWSKGNAPWLEINEVIDFPLRVVNG